MLAKNEKTSSGKTTKHIDIRYFFVTDMIGSNKLTLEYCPTGEMLGDFFTKPVQGALFIKFRKYILNLEHDDISAYSPERSHECIGLNKAVSEDGNKEVLMDATEDNSTQDDNKSRHHINMTYTDVLRSNK